MTTVLVLLFTQALLGAFDNLWHHEWEARLPQRRSARFELRLHAAREAIYAVLFFGLAWWEWHGAATLLLAGLLVAEVGITLADFLEEDRSRQLPPFERTLHTVLTIGYGLFLAALAPVLWAWWAEPSGWAPTSYGLLSWMFTAAAVGVGAWAVRNAWAVHQLGRVDTNDAALHRGSPLMRGRAATLVTGATGFVGEALVRNLLLDGERVVVWSRDRRQAQAQFGPAVWVVEDLDDLPPETRLKAIVHLAGARVLGRPWTTRQRGTLMSSRTGTAQALLALMRRLEQVPEVLVAASAVGYYGATPGPHLQPLDEQASAGSGQFQSDLCVAAEHEAMRAAALGVRVVRMRFGVVLGRRGGAYPPQALASRCGFGAMLGDGSQSAPWVHLDDAVGLVQWALRHPRVRGAVNATAPHVPTQAEWTAALAASFGRKVRLQVPRWPLRVAMGEMSGLLLDGQSPVPAMAMAMGYRFKFPELQTALAALATKDSMPRGTARSVQR